MLGGLYAEREGYIDTSAWCTPTPAAAKLRGAEIVEHNRVLALDRAADGGVDGSPPNRAIVNAEHVVNAAGLWAKQVGLMAGVDLPVTPLEHHYLVTEAIPEIKALDRELPLVVDLEGFTYMRQEQKGLLLGIYELEHKHWHMEGAPWDYGTELIPEDIDRIADELAFGFRRYPCLRPRASSVG